eukprot:scaffold18639_cov57-Phaeocystis_antarctica.AAC.9
MLLQPRPLRRRLVVALVVVDAALEVDEALLRVMLLAGRQFHLHGRPEEVLEYYVLFEVLFELRGAELTLVLLAHGCKDWLSHVELLHILQAGKVDDEPGCVDLGLLLVLLQEPGGELVVLGKVLLGEALGYLGHEVVEAVAGRPHVLCSDEVLEKGAVVLLLGVVVLERLVLGAELDRVGPQLGGVVGELCHKREEPPPALRRVALVTNTVRRLVALEQASGVKAGVVVLLVERTRLQLLITREFVHVAEPYGLHLLARVGLAVAHEALLVKAARLRVGAALDLGDEVLVEQALAVAAVARGDEEVLEALPAGPTLEDADVRPAQLWVGKDALKPRGDLGHLRGVGLAPRLLARHEQVVVLVRHEPAIVAALAGEVVGAVGECKHIGLIVKRVVAARLRPQAVLDQREDIQILLVAVRVGGPADCDDLLPEILGLVAVPLAVCHKLGKLRVEDALVALPHSSPRTLDLART